MNKDFKQAPRCFFNYGLHFPTALGLTASLNKAMTSIFHFFPEEGLKAPLVLSLSKSLNCYVRKILSPPEGERSKGMFRGGLNRQPMGPAHCQPPSHAP